MVIVKKANCKLRFCLDPTDLNKATKRHHENFGKWESFCQIR